MNTPETETPELCGSEESSHRWIGDTCGRCGVAYGIFAERTLKELNEKARTLERENAQLRKELGQLKGKWHQVSDERDQLKSKLFRVEYLAQTNWQMAEELANNMEAMLTPFEGHPVKDCDEPYCVVCGCDKALSRFQTLKQQQPK